MKDKIMAKDQWEVKWFREGAFMPFGSMMNSFGMINKGTQMPVEEFERVARAIFNLSKEFIRETNDSSEVGTETKDVNEPDFY